MFGLGAVVPASADTTAETGITITTENAGSFSIAFAEFDGGYTFVNENGGSTISVSAIEGDTATATVKLAWTDDRADGAREGYTIGLGASDLTSSVNQPDGDGVYTIPSTYISIIQIGNEPLSPPVSLDAVRIVYESDPLPPPGAGSLEIVLRLDVPPSSYPTTYKTKLLVEVIYGDSEL